MAMQTELAGLGIQPGAAKALGSSAYVSGLTATGTGQSDALALTSSFAAFGTVAASTGAILPSATGASPTCVVNGGANALSVYPASGEFINASNANTAFSVTAAKTAWFWPVGNRWFAVLSA